MFKNKQSVFFKILYTNIFLTYVWSFFKITNKRVKKDLEEINGNLSREKVTDNKKLWKI